MKTVTWEIGTNLALDTLFNDLREKHFQNKSHRLAKNYSKDFLNFSVALTICFDDNGIPEMCSSIGSRDCWPENSYRILNRLWKSSNKISYPKIMSPSFAESAKSQIEWLNKHKIPNLIFASRETEKWQDFGILNFKHYGIEFKKDNYKYLTCPNEADCSCWQKIIYIGESCILKKWKRKL